MAFINWNENLSVKIKSIDDQHKKLIEMINDFYDNIINLSNKDNISRLIRARSITLRYILLPRKII